ncbi:hypothetical protein [Comamonas thiooxydans]|uniref:hypothetical protein n=1 Tax=Comamonas thiooxydans TaxID=363952 RepID=UPI00103B634A|nr:hypothetical protein [Comamonas thiooxydans]
MKIAIDTAYMGRMFLCFSKQGRLVWSRRGLAIEVSNLDSLVFAELCELGINKLERVGVEVVGVIANHDSYKEIVGVNRLPVIQLVRYLVSGGDFADGPLLSVAPDENLSKIGNAHSCPYEFSIGELAYIAKYLRKAVAQA